MARKVRVGGFWSGLFGGENKTIIYDTTWTGRKRKRVIDHNKRSKSTRTDGYLWGSYNSYTATCNRCNGSGKYKSPNYKGNKPPQDCRSCNGTGTYRR